MDRAHIHCLPPLHHATTSKEGDALSLSHSRHGTYKAGQSPIHTNTKPRRRTALEKEKKTQLLL
jgi:hypothetical protein